MKKTAPLFLVLLVGLALIGAENDSQSKRTMAETSAVVISPASPSALEPEYVEASVEPEPETAPIIDYVLNTNTMKFHKPSCRAVSQIATRNYSELSATRDEVLSMGYSPCGICYPEMQTRSG